MAFPPWGLSFSGNKSKTTTTSNGTFSTTRTPTLPGWATSLTEGAAGRVESLLGRNPAADVASSHPLQNEAAHRAADLGGYEGIYGQAVDFTRAAADGGWAKPFQEAPTPFASGGKAYDYTDRYLNPYLSQVVDATAADLDAHAGRTRARQDLELAGAGAFGGSGAALTRSFTEGELARARASALGGLRSSGWETALGAAQGDADRATQARIANAQLALHDRALKIALAEGLGARQLTVADQLAGLASGLDANRRANIEALGAVGAAQRGIEQAQLSAPLTSTQQIVAMLQGLPIGLFAGETEAGVKSDQSVEKTKGVTLGGSIGTKT
jgi:hypothetical protein